MNVYLTILQSSVTGLAIITAALLTGWLGTRVYRHQKTVDREEELRQLRAKEYERFVAVVSDRWEYLRWPQPEQEERKRNHWAQYNKARWQLFLVGSDEVIRAAAALDWHIVKGEQVNEEYIQLYTDMLFSMRADSFVVSGLDHDEIGRMFPLKYNIPFNYSPEIAEQVVAQQQKNDQQPRRETQKSDQTDNMANNNVRVIKIQPSSQPKKAPQQSWWRKMFRK